MVSHSGSHLIFVGTTGLAVEHDVCGEVLVVEVDFVLVVALVRVVEVVLELVLGHVGITKVVYWYGVPEEYTNPVLVVVKLVAVCVLVGMTVVVTVLVLNASTFTVDVTLLATENAKPVENPPNCSVAVSGMIVFGRLQLMTVVKIMSV